jgi:perosamine synthetase
MTLLPTFIPVAEPDLGELEERFVVDALRSGWVSSIGAYIDRFEREFAEFCGVAHCIALANGTVALQLALAARGIGPGDEVIVPDLTFVATAAAVVHSGATPVLVDVDDATMCVDPQLVVEAMTSRTRGVIPVHLYGHPAQMVELRSICAAQGAFLLEDAAEAHGAKLGGTAVGALGDVASFSFYGNKLMTTGEGGALTTNDAAFARRARFLKDHAMSPDRRYFHPELGFNYRMTNLQAALGCAQLERFPEILARKRQILGWYADALEGTGVELNPRGALADPVCWLVVARLPREAAPDVSAVAARMRAQHRIDTRPFFVPMHELPPLARSRFVKRSELAVSTDAHSRGLCLPSSNALTEADVARVVEALLECAQLARR